MESTSPAPQFPTLKLKLKLGKKPDSPDSSTSPVAGEKKRKGQPPSTGKGVKKQKKSQSPQPGVTAVAAPPSMATTKTTYIPLGRQAGPAFLDTKSGPPRNWFKRDVRIATLSGYPMDFLGWVTTEPPRRSTSTAVPSVRTKVKAAPKKESIVEVAPEDASMASSPA